MRSAKLPPCPTLLYLYVGIFTAIAIRQQACGNRARPDDRTRHPHRALALQEAVRYRPFRRIDERESSEPAETRCDASSMSAIEASSAAAATKLDDAV
jgi:hypothetical protein